jgi:hypothetical protein
MSRERMRRAGSTVPFVEVVGEASQNVAIMK